MRRMMRSDSIGAQPLARQEPDGFGQNRKQYASANE